MDLSEEIKLEKNKKHVIEIVVDRLKVRDGIQQRLTDSVETASALSGGVIVADIVGGESVTFSESFCLPGLRDKHSGDRAEIVFVQ